MAEVTTASAPFVLTLTEDERALLLNFLQSGLRDKKIEARRTEAPDYWKLVHHEEGVMQNLINRLHRPTPVPGPVK